jgi:hypothetical protein
MLEGLLVITVVQSRSVLPEGPLEALEARVDLLSCAKETKKEAGEI